MTSRTFTTIPAGLMVGALGFVLSAAELRLTWGDQPDEAISLALTDHPMPAPIEAACRAAWAAMVEPSARL